MWPEKNILTQTQSDHLLILIDVYSNLVPAACFRQVELIVFIKQEVIEYMTAQMSVCRCSQTATLWSCWQSNFTKQAGKQESKKCFFCRDLIMIFFFFSHSFCSCLVIAHNFCRFFAALSSLFLLSVCLLAFFSPLWVTLFQCERTTHSKSAWR